jgi:hypothetical protein
MVTTKEPIMIDRYTKAVLTVIAACLMWICLRDAPVIPLAFAQTDRGASVQKVQIVSIDESPTLPWEALPVAQK